MMEAAELSDKRNLVKRGKLKLAVIASIWLMVDGVFG